METGFREAYELSFRDFAEVVLGQFGRNMEADPSAWFR